MTGGPVCRPPDTSLASAPHCRGAYHAPRAVIPAPTAYQNPSHAIRRGRRLGGPVCSWKIPHYRREGKPLPYRVSKRSLISRRDQAENNDGRPSVPPLRICLWLPHLIVGAHIMRLQAGNTRPYGIPRTLVYSVGADDSRPARLRKSLVIGGRMRTSAPTANMDVRCILQVPAPRRPVCSWKIPYYRR